MQPSSGDEKNAHACAELPCLTQPFSLSRVFTPPLSTVWSVAAMERELHVRLSASKIALGRAAPGDQEGISRTTVNALRAMVARDPGLTTVSAEGRAALMDIVVSTAWHGDDQSKVLSLFAPPGKSTENIGSRRPLQHFAPSFLSYFTHGEWDLLLGADGWHDKVDLVMRRALELGCINPAEPTLKMLSSLCLLVSNPGAARLQTSVKRQYLVKLKEMFRSKRRRFQTSGQAPQTYLVVLPPAPSALTKDAPELWARAFPNSERREGRPVPAQISLAALMEVDNSYGCRDRMGDFIMNAAPLADQGGPSATQLLLQQMLALQQQHFATLQLGSGVRTGVGAAPRAVAALAPPRAPAVPLRLLGPHGEESAGSLLPLELVGQHQAQQHVGRQHGCSGERDGGLRTLVANVPPPIQPAFDELDASAPAMHAAPLSLMQQPVRRSGSCASVGTTSSEGGLRQLVDTVQTPNTISPSARSTAAVAKAVGEVTPKSESIQAAELALASHESRGRQQPAACELGAGSQRCLEESEECEDDEDGEEEEGQPAAVACSADQALPQQPTCRGGGNLCDSLLQSYRAHKAVTPKATPSKPGVVAPLTTPAVKGAAPWAMRKRPAAAAQKKEQAKEPVAAKRRGRPRTAEAQGSGAKRLALQDAPAAPRPTKRPKYEHEASRNQFLVRTGIVGVRGLGSIQFKYKAGNKKDRARAEAEAENKVQELVAEMEATE